MSRLVYSLKAFTATMLLMMVSGCGNPTGSYFVSEMYREGALREKDPRKAMMYRMMSNTSAFHAHQQAVMQARSVQHPYLTIIVPQQYGLDENVTIIR